MTRAQLEHAIRKLAAGCPKDIDFVRVMLRERIVDVDVVCERLAQTPRLEPERREALQQRVRGLV